VRKLRDVVNNMKDHERRIMDLSTRQAKMPRKDFLKAFPKATRPTSNGSTN
jgi:RNA polymerase primary sigma factor